MTIESLKLIAKNNLPKLYRVYYDTRAGIAERHGYPIIAQVNMRDLDYTMRISSRHELGVVKGRFFERELIEKMLEVTKEGDIIANIGAATGTHAIPLGIKTGTRGKVYAFEPDVENYYALTYNINLNGLTNVTPLPFALWDEDKPLNLVTGGVKKQSPYISTLISMPGKVLTKEIQVEGSRLDSLVNWGIMEIPSTVNIDVEGAGMRVLTGMGDLCPKHVFMEIHPAYGEDYEQIKEFMSRKGYVSTALGTRIEQFHVHFELS